MEAIPLLAVQGLHVFSGLAWGGGQILLAVGVWPALLRLPAPEARRAINALEGPVGFSQMLFGTAVMTLGLLRATWFGPVRSWEAATATEYGRICLVAFGLTAALAVRGARTARRHERLFAGEHFHPHARIRLLSAHATDILLLLGIIACMVMLHFGI